MPGAKGRGYSWAFCFPFCLFAAALTPILRTPRQSLSWDE